jgi:hypothetical protein
MSKRFASPLCNTLFRARATERLCASTVTIRAPFNRHAITIATLPTPEPRSSTDAADGHQLDAYQAKSRSSVVYLLPSFIWKMRKCPLRASRLSSGSGHPDTATPGGMTPGLTQPLKTGSGAYLPSAAWL